MKKIILIAGLFASILACSKDNDTSSYSSDPSPGTPSSGSSSGCGFHNGHQLYKGPEGGCYYINSNGNKTYVEPSECKC